MTLTHPHGVYSLGPRPMINPIFSIPLVCILEAGPSLALREPRRLGINVEFEVGATEVRLLESVSLVSFLGVGFRSFRWGGGGRKAGGETAHGGLMYFLTAL